MPATVVLDEIHDDNGDGEDTIVISTTVTLDDGDDGTTYGTGHAAVHDLFLELFGAAVNADDG